MARRPYSVDEVEGLIPTLERIFTKILQLRVGLRAIEAKLERAGVNFEAEMEQLTASDDALLEAAEHAEPPAEPLEVRQARAVFRGFYEALSDGLEQIRSLGGEVKDLDIGLVDFPGRRGNDDILLCWRLGEKRIEYWHTLDGGFANRRPIDEGIARPPTTRVD